jgi:hypothetical protein
VPARPARPEWLAQVRLERPPTPAAALGRPEPETIPAENSEKQNAEPQEKG